MELRGRKVLVIGGAGLIGSHAVDELVKEDVAEIRIYDNFIRGIQENLADALKDPHIKIFDIGGDICQSQSQRRICLAASVFQLHSGVPRPRRLDLLVQRRLAHQTLGYLSPLQYRAQQLGQAG